MQASLFFILMSVIYLSHDLHTKIRQILSVICLVLSGVAVYFGK